MNAIRRIDRTRRELGLANWCWYYFSRMLQTVSGQRCSLEKFHVVVQEVAREPRLPPGRGVDVQVRPVLPDDPATADFPRPTETLKFRYDQGAVCLAAYKGSEFVGFHWLIFGDYVEDAMRTRFCPRPAGETAWNFDFLIRPEHRLGLTFIRLWDETHAYLRDRGVTRVMSRISASSVNSFTSHLNMGARRLGGVSYLRMGRWEMLLSGLQPHVHLSRRSDDVPDVVLRDL